jgi:hypothetical protein
MLGNRCAGCGQPLERCAQVPNQQYCGKPGCQKKRKRRWKQAKRRSDSDYRENQARAQHAWLEHRPGFWRDWRARHPEYCERNRQQQQRRNARRRVRDKIPPSEGATELIAKRNASRLFPADFPGVFWIIPDQEAGDCKEERVAGKDRCAFRDLPAQSLIAKRPLDRISEFGSLPLI